ncbi:hypothetical protein AB6A40_002601 [Gnathostoma spinigerum]|uniref:Copper homeostasis protein cutC homolog n=1 Tax=Gnathostoma spinigerum TaxID=75299 RepID=A0ABD6EH56_9BILA
MDSMRSDYQRGPMDVEICVDSFSSVKAAAEGGASRFELCSALCLGGLTPSAGLLKLAKKNFPNIPSYCLIRSRCGDFVFNDDDMVLMLEDLKILNSYGADGFAFGALTPEGQLDEAKCGQILDAARPVPVTLNRAFDYTIDWKLTVDTAVKLGFDGILTSGLAATAKDGATKLKEIVAYSNNRIAIMAGNLTLFNRAQFLNCA